MPSLHSPKIEVLIVDDEVQARELLSESQQYQGVKTRTISTIAEVSSARRHIAES
jgi:DNA-binding NtrC family response regulator